jgi:hypothetical protein
MLERARHDLIDAALSAEIDLRPWLQARLESATVRRRLCEWLRLLQQHFTYNDDDHASKLAELLEPIEAESSDLLQTEKLLRAGLGLMFVRFDVAFQRFYIHDILSDILPSAVRDEVAHVGFVPAGDGSLGGVVRTVKKNFADASDERVELSPDKAVVSLWCSFSDPRGRVAIEDHILGTRSWLAAPVFDDARDGGARGVAGVLVAFFPIDGALQPDDKAKLDALRRVFWMHAERISNQLLLALENEALSTFLEPTGTAPSARARLERGSAAERLVSATAGDPVARPIGYFAATELDAEGSHLSVLDQPFAALLLRNYRLAALDPTRLGVPSADTMQVLSSGVRPAWHKGVLIPRWQRQGAEEDLHGPGFYTPELQLLARPLTALEIRAGLSRQGFLRSGRRVSSPILEQVSRANRLYRSEEIGVDLVIPLARRNAASWAGVVRINCLRTDEHDTTLAALASTISSSAAMGELSDTVATLLGEISRTLSTASEVEDVKRLRDLRFIVATSLAEGLAECFSPVSARALASNPFSRLALARHSATLLVGEQAVRGLAELPKLLHQFATELQAVPTPRPRIPMITVWRMDSRPLVAAEEGTLLDDLLIADPGLYQTVTFLTEVIAKRPGLTLSTATDGSYARVHESGLQSLMLPPVPNPLGPGFLQLCFSHEQRGRVQLRVMYEDGRELASAECSTGSYPEPLAWAVVERAAVFGALAEHASPTPTVYAELEQVADREDAAPLTIEMFRAACPVTAACRPFDVLCELAELLQSSESEALVRVARIESPLTDSGESPFAAPRARADELRASALLAALSLGEEGSSLASIRQRWLERVQTERLLVAQTEALAAASLLRRFGRLVSHYVHVPLASLITSYERELMKPLHQRDSDLAEAARRMYGGLVLVRYVTSTIRQHSGSDDDSFVSQSSATTLGWTDLDELLALLDPNRGGSVLGEFASAGARIVCKYPTGKSLRVHGDFGRWSIVLFTLLKNALEAALQARAHDASVNVTLMPEHNAAAGDVMLYLRMAISNPCDDVDSRVFAIMQECFGARRKSAPSNPRKADSMGLGLATAGRILRDLEVSRRFELHPDDGHVRCILDVPMFGG